MHSLYLQILSKMEHFCIINTQAWTNGRVHSIKSGPDVFGYDAMSLENVLGNLSPHLGFGWVSDSAAKFVSWLYKDVRVEFKGALIIWN